MRRFIKNISLIFLGLLSSCMLGPDHKDPQITTPGQFAEAGCMPTDEQDLSQWWTQFNDPLLNDLVAQALRGNLDLRIAVEKINELRAQYQFERAKLWPQVEATGEYIRSRRSQNTFAGGAFASLSDFQTPFSPNFFGPLVQSFYQLGFDMNWELDFFGKLRRAKESAWYDYMGSFNNARGVQVTLLAEVARNYLDIRTFQNRIRLTENHIRFQQELFELACSRFEAGLTNEIEVQQVKSLLEQSTSELFPLRSALQQTVYGLAVLLGKPPEDFACAFSEIGPIPLADGKVPIGLPSQLLRRRPDIAQAENQIDSARALIGSYKAEYFPDFTLTGTAGIMSNKLNNLFKWASRYWSIGPIFNWTLIDFGKIRANVRAQTSRQQQALLNYEKVVLNSFQEVENALVAYAQENEKNVSLKEEVKADARARDLDKDLYRAGLKDFSIVLNAEIKLMESEDSYIQSLETLMTDLVALYKALGGGWEVPAPNKQ